MEKFED